MRSKYRERGSVGKGLLAVGLAALLCSSSLAAQPTVHKIQGSEDPVPGAPDATWDDFRPFGDVAVYGSSVLFGAGTVPQFAVWLQEGLYIAAGGVLGRLVDSSTPIPGGTGTFDVVGDVRVDEHGYVFARPTPDSTSNDGIYRDPGDGLEVVADLSMPAPNTGSPFERFGPFSYDAGTVAFVGISSRQSAVYLHDGTLRIVASPETAYLREPARASLDSPTASPRPRVASPSWASGTPPTAPAGWGCSSRTGGRSSR